MAFWEKWGRKIFATIGALLALGIVFSLAYRLPLRRGNLPATDGVPVPTRADVLPGVVVPEPGGAVPEGVAKPEGVQPTLPGSLVDRRNIQEIKVVGDKFEPDTIIAYRGEVVHANFLAVDKNYDFTQPDYGLSGAIRKGVGLVVEFQAVTTGDFVFYCASCGGPKNGPVGRLIVVEKEP